MKGKFEAILYLVFDVIVLVMAIMIKLGYLKLNKFEGKEDIFSITLIILCIICFIYGVYSLRKELKKDKSSFTDIKKCSDDYIKSKLSCLEYDTISIDNNKNFYSIEIGYEKVDFSLSFHPLFVDFYFECKDWYFDSLTKEEQDKLDDISESYDPLKLSKDEILNKFISFVMNNRG